MGAVYCFRWHKKTKKFFGFFENTRLSLKKKYVKRKKRTESFTQILLLYIFYVVALQFQFVYYIWFFSIS